MPDLSAGMPIWRVRGYVPIGPVSFEQQELRMVEIPAAGVLMAAAVGQRDLKKLSNGLGSPVVLVEVVRVDPPLPR